MRIEKNSLWLVFPRPPHFIKIELDFDEMTPYSCRIELNSV